MFCIIALILFFSIFIVPLLRKGLPVFSPLIMPPPANPAWKHPDGHTISSLVYRGDFVCCLVLSRLRCGCNRVPWPAHLRRAFFWPTSVISVLALRTMLNIHLIQHITSKLAWFVIDLDVVWKCLVRIVFIPNFLKEILIFIFIFSAPIWIFETSTPNCVLRM